MNWKREAAAKYISAQNSVTKHWVHLFATDDYRIGETLNMEKQQEANRWHRVPKHRPPMPGLLVLVVVDGKVMPGQYNEQRSMWFAGERPIFPPHWRPMPRVPRSMKK